MDSLIELYHNFLIPLKYFIAFINKVLINMFSNGKLLFSLYKMYKVLVHEEILFKIGRVMKLKESKK